MELEAGLDDLSKCISLITRLVAEAELVVVEVELVTERRDSVLFDSFDLSVFIVFLLGVCLTVVVFAGETGLGLGFSLTVSVLLLMVDLFIGFAEAPSNIFPVSDLIIFFVCDLTGTFLTGSNDFFSSSKFTK